MGIPVEMRSQYIREIREISAQEGNERVLFDSILRFCLDFQDEYSETERDLFGDIMVKIMARLDMEKRVEIAELLATIDRAPLKILRYLALQPIAIARPVLTKSQVLTDHDLIIVIRIRQYEHMGAIASRAIVTIPVTAELIKCGNDTVLAILLDNEGAQISPRSFQRLLKAAGVAPDIQRALLKRGDLPNVIGREIVRLAGEPIRNFLLANDRADLLIYLDVSVDTAPGAEPEERGLKVSELSLLYRTLSDRHERQPLGEADFVQAVMRHDASSVICLIAILAPIPLAVAMDWVTGRDFNPAIIACKAMGFQRDTVEKLLKSGIHPSSVVPLTKKKFLATYDHLNRKMAKNVLKIRAQL